MHVKQYFKIPYINFHENPLSRLTDRCGEAVWDVSFICERNQNFIYCIVCRFQMDRFSSKS